MQSAASNPKALLTAYSDYQKCLWGSARLKRLTEQPKNVDTVMQKEAENKMGGEIMNALFSEVMKTPEVKQQIVEGMRKGNKKS